MTDEDLLSHFDAKKILAVKTLGSFLSDEPPAKRADESAAAYSRRNREDREVYLEEKALRLRAAAEQVLWDQQKGARAADLFENAPLSAEEETKLAAAQENIKRREAQQKQSDRETGFRLAPDGMGSNAMEIDDKKGKRKK